MFSMLKPLQDILINAGVLKKQPLLKKGFNVHEFLEDFPNEEKWRLFFPQTFDENPNCKNILQQNIAPSDGRKYLPAMCAAMNLSMENLNQPLTTDFIRHLHFIATDNLREKGQSALNAGVRPGQFRIGGEDVLSKLTAKNTSEQGLQEIIERLHRQASGHLKTDRSKDNRDHDIQRFSKNDLYSNQSTTITDNKIQDILAEIRANDDDIFLKSKTIDVEKKLQIYLGDYQQDISAAKAFTDPLKKEEAIFRSIAIFIQNCETLHPFGDGNTRTLCLLLLNHLLIQNNYPPATLASPHKFKGHSVSELIDEIKNGIQNTIAISQTRTSTNFLTADQAEVLMNSTYDVALPVSRSEALKMKRADIVSNLHIEATQPAASSPTPSPYSATQASRLSSATPSSPEPEPLQAWGEPKKDSTSNLAAVMGVSPESFKPKLDPPKNTTPIQQNHQHSPQPSPKLRSHFMPEEPGVGVPGVIVGPYVTSRKK